jgi:Ca2+/Na+ antiporter
MQASLHVARKGEGPMTVANVFGSNIFDVLFALGLPWVISTVFLGKNITVESANVEAAILVGIFVLLIASLIVSRWTQGVVSGVIYLTLYAAFLVYSFGFSN